MSKLIASLLILGLACIAVDAGGKHKKCGPHSTYTDCGTACPLTCQHPSNEGESCIELCVAGCFCNKGYLLDECTGKCVCKSDCPK